MKTFIYTYERKKNDINGNPKHWVTVYRIKRGAPVRLGREECGYIGERPTVVYIAQKAGEIPKRYPVYTPIWELERDKIAVFHRLD